ncbi:MAG: hypothetical protein ACREOZ_05295, partial [Gloeomargaritales cyanobacterium]
DDTRSTLNYDLILGRPFQRTAGFNVMSANDIIEWNGLSVPFHPKGWWKNRNNVADLLHNSPARVQALEADLFRDPTNMLDSEAFVTEIKPAKYEAQDIESVVAQQNHLSDSQKLKLGHLLKEFPELFSGKLGHHKKKKVHLDFKA